LVRLRLHHVAWQAEGGFVISGGNFHGEYPAKAADYLAIAVAELVRPHCVWCVCSRVLAVCVLC
jgi:hypothetical protein